MESPHVLKSPPPRKSALQSGVEPLALGPVLVARRSATRSATTVRLSASREEFIAFYFPVGSQTGRGDDIQLIDGQAANAVPETQGGVALLAPYRFLAHILPPGEQPKRLPCSAVIETMRLYLDGLLALERDRLCRRQGDLVAYAIRSLLAAAFLPPGRKGGLGIRRRASLIDRAVAHIEANLDASLSAERLCAALGCSRSALYRAAAPAGGVTALIADRRMLAVRARLSDPGEARLIAEIAQASGFSDIAQFNRRFKARFGVTPGAIRRAATAPPRSGSASSRPRAATRMTPCE